MFRGTHIIKADFDRDTVVDDVTGTDGWAESGSYHGHTVVRKADGSHAIAVGDDAIVTSRTGQNAANSAKGVIDTRRGYVRRYPGQHAAVDATLGTFSDGFLRHWRPRQVFGNTPHEEAEFDGRVGLGRYGRFTEGVTAAVQLLYVFESGDAVDVDVVRSYVEEHSGEGQQFAQWEDTAVSRNGGMVVVEGRVTRQPE